MPKARPKLTPEQAEDAERLRRIWEARKQASQEVFGAEHDLGTQGNVTQYLNQHIPLNIEATVKFAKGLGVSVEDISPRLAAFLSSVPLRPRRPYEEQRTGSDRRIMQRRQSAFDGNPSMARACAAVIRPCARPASIPACSSSSI